ncbi:MAG TPA: ABC transporter permease subunit [Pelobium sp.]
MKNREISLKGLFFQAPVNQNSVAKSNNKNSFWIMVSKEIADHIHSWRFVVLIALVILTFIASLYASVGNLSATLANTNDPDHNFLYLKLLTATDNTIPPFHVLLSFLAPLLGIGLGFDAVNSEQNNGTLSRLMAQPVFRDNLLLAKFTSALILIGSLFIVLVLLMLGGGLLWTGVRIEPQELLRITTFTAISIVYVAFWLSLAILLSILFKQAATSALTAIGFWLFFTIFYQILVTVLVKAFLPNPSYLSSQEVAGYNDLILNILRVSPNQLYTDAATSLLMPSVRSLGPLSMEQMAGAIPSPLPFRESLLIVWSQVSGLLAATIVCFALSYYLFMRREIRS